MPIYAYRCTACGQAKDILRKMSDPVLSECPFCGEPTFVKQVTAAGFQLKGSGWYVTDFRGDNKAPKAGDAAAGAEGGKSGEADDGKNADGKSADGKGSEAKPADGKSADSPRDAMSKSGDAAASPAAPPAGSGGAGGAVSSSAGGTGGAKAASASPAPSAPSSPAPGSAGTGSASK